MNKFSFLSVDTPFENRHIGVDGIDEQVMLEELGLNSRDELVRKTLPEAILVKTPLALPAGLSERDALAKLQKLIDQNEIYRSLIGQGYYDTITPPVILRNVLENPGWYTQYTPYQAEIAQGRLEALLNFQTMIVELTAMEIANASLLDEGTAVAEAVMLAHRVRGSETRTKVFLHTGLHPQTVDVVETRGEALGFTHVQGSTKDIASVDSSFVAVCLQYPTSEGTIEDYRILTNELHAKGVTVIVATDLLALIQLTPPGTWGADIVVGNSQRFGVPYGFGGPHAAFMATKDEFKRQLPGRLVGISKDAAGKSALRLSLQTREQHIRRDKATSNICTAQVLLAVMASMYAVYHGPDGLKKISSRVNALTRILGTQLKKFGLALNSDSYFDTLKVNVAGKKAEIIGRAVTERINLREFSDGSLGISLDEKSTFEEISRILAVFTGKQVSITESDYSGVPESIPLSLNRQGEILTHEVFRSFHSEHEMLRYLHRLQSKDLSLTTSMIPLGSCTMKLNATAEMIPVTWPGVGQIHPFAPASQTKGTDQVHRDLENQLCAITGLDACSLQPNAGSQGEYAGLLVIRAYHLARGVSHRTVCLIPESAHGTNPASAAMAGMKIVPVKCDERGNVDVEHLKSQAAAHASNLSALMITYPSTHGVFESAIVEITKTIHAAGGQVYMDGANLNAHVGLCRAGEFGVDVCHINLHKTFCIPHGGGGPGMGPICVKSHLQPFLPSHVERKVGGEKGVGAVCSAPWGSASILVIPWVYITMMGGTGLKRATEVAILNANYIASRLEPYYPVLYRGANGFVAHECILDLRDIKRRTQVEVEDVAKRLMDYGFHAPTVSFPVPGTLMVEPTESESKRECDRFCDAMISIAKEIEAIEKGTMHVQNNPLKNAPHTAELVTADEWTFEYGREQAAYPAAWLREHKFWPAVRRIDNVYGDRNLFCVCAPMDSYTEE